MYTAHAGIELYAEAFERGGRARQARGLRQPPRPDFYGLPRNTATVTLEKARGRCPRTIPSATATVVPLRAGEAIGWRFAG